MSESEFQARASEFCRKRAENKPLFHSRLGIGQEGYVWETLAGSAIKVFERRGNFEDELKCYQILKDFEITKIHAFNVPCLLDWSDDLRVIEMTIVKPPFILDFGKARLYFKPEYPTDAVDYHERQMEETFGEWLPQVENALAYLESLGIYYVDANLRNIKVDGLPPPEQ